MVLKNVCTSNFRQNIWKLIRTRQDQKFWYPLLRNFWVLLAKFYFLKVDWRLHHVSLPKDFLNISWQFVYKVFYTSYPVSLYMSRIKPSLNTAKLTNIIRARIKRMAMCKMQSVFPISSCQRNLILLFYLVHTTKKHVNSFIVLGSCLRWMNVSFNINVQVA